MLILLIGVNWLYVEAPRSTVYLSGIGQVLGPPEYAAQPTAQQVGRHSCTFNRDGILSTHIEVRDERWPEMETAVVRGELKVSSPVVN